MPPVSKHTARTDASSNDEQVATSNQTLNYFLGGARPAWLPEHPSTASRRPLIRKLSSKVSRTGSSTVPDTTTGSSVDTSLPKPAGSASAAALSQQLWRSDCRQSRDIAVKFSAVPTSGSTGNRAASLPVTISGTIPSTQAHNGTSQAGPSPSMILRPTASISISDRRSPQTAATSPETESVQTDAPQPLLGSVDKSTPAIMQEFPELMTGLGGSQALRSPVSSVEGSGPGTTSTQARRINEADVQDKLSRSGHPYETLEVRSDSDSDLAKQTWVQELDAHIARINVESLHQDIEWPCYSTLRQACAFSDTFFVVLHRQLCLWTFNALDLYAKHDVSRETLELAFNLLNTIMRQDVRVSMPHIRWFSQFPTSMDIHACVAFNPAKRFLGTLASAGYDLVHRVIQRNYPLMAWEIRELLKCDSPTLRPMLFTFYRRIIHITDNNISTSFHYLFKQDWENEEFMVRSKCDRSYKTDSRNRTCSRYMSLMMQSQRSGNTNKGSNTLSPPITEHSPVQASRPSAPRTLTAAHLTAPTAYMPNLVPAPTRPNGGQPGQPTGFQPTQDLAIPQVNLLLIRDGRVSVPSHGSPPPANMYQQVSQPYQLSPHAASYMHRRAMQNGLSSQSAHPRNWPDGASVGPCQRGGLANQLSLAAPSSSMSTAASVVAPNVTQVQSPTAPRYIQSDVQRGHNHPDNELPLGAHEWTSVQASLHLSGLRSPTRIPATLKAARSYQFLRDFATKPTLMVTETGPRMLQFSVTAQEIAMKNRALDARQGGLPINRFFDGSRRYRLRLCKSTNDGTDIAIEDWSILPTVWPENIFILFNGQACFPLRKLHFRHDLPIELTDGVQTGMNEIKVSFPRLDGGVAPDTTYHMAVEIIETWYHDSVKAMVDEAAHVTIEDTMRNVRARLKPPEEDDIIVMSDSLAVSVADPFTSSRCIIPVRGRQCRHLECFCLETWLQTRTRKTRMVNSRVEIVNNEAEPCMVDVWKCPLCGLDARPPSLRVDDLFVMVGERLVKNRSLLVKKVLIREDGSWTPVVENEMEDMGDEPSTKEIWLNDSEYGEK
ncbi:hypothetical protein S7711_04009 [Stachybotrys chartarum IBT 7711]|uniref:SP-RING-type domain-containing protein n=1 Tax=Stachybotrys chartarum (strain CBS 109288 / IBT 7711) TaxID=1280523 RepID=A0A084AXG2_STACB|nr:hypothetical protein S7711_04009 [Stachybotrys chartarum IBT 7711]